MNVWLSAVLWGTAWGTHGNSNPRAATRTLLCKGYNCKILGKGCVIKCGAIANSLRNTEELKPWSSSQNCQLLFSWHKSMGNAFFHSFRASPPVLSTWLQKVKFIAKKPKCAGLTQEIGSSTPNSRSMPWKNVINWTWLRLSISDWQGGFAISSPHIYAVPVKVLLVGLPNKKQLNLDI